MTCRTMARRAGWPTIAALLLSALVAPSARSQSDPPNIVFVLVDDLGWADLGCYGQTFHESPRIDGLAEQGMRFTDAYAACPVCSPTRASVMAGQTPAGLGLTNFIPGHWRPWAKLDTPPNAPHLDLETITYAELLREAGYATGYFGKWHLGGRGHKPGDQGFETWIETGGRHFAPNFRTNPPTDVPDGQYLAEFLTDQTIDFIEANRERPFVVQLSHYAVHIPLEAEQELIAKYTAKVPPEEGVNHPVYAAMVEHVDRSVGRILDALDELELAEDTVVVVTSDNGGLYRRFDGKGPAVTSNAPLRDEKGSLYEGGIRVPMIVRWPGVVEPGSVSDVPVSTIDLLPTFAAIAGLSAGAVPSEVEGVNLEPILTGTGPIDRQGLFWHYPHYHHTSPAGAIRSGHHKLIHFYEDDRVELYDLAEDLGEEENLAAKRPGLVEELRASLDAYRQRVGALMPSANPHYDPERSGRWVPRSQKGKIDLSTRIE